MGEAVSDFLSHLGSQEHHDGPPPGMDHGAGGSLAHMSISFSPFMGIMTVILIITMIRNLNLGNLVSAFMFMGLIAIPALTYKFFHMNEIFCFWFSYIITRPLGSSLADWMDFGHDGGLGLGTSPVSLASTIIIIALVAYISFKGRKVKDTTYNPGLS